MGFKEIGSTVPNYFYIVNSKRENRYKYRKDVLVKEGYEPSKTELQIMDDRGIGRIYDSGSLKYQWDKLN